MKNNRIIYIIKFTLLSLPIFAQTQEPKQLGDEEINVVKAYKPVLSEATRISNLPEGDTSKEVITLQNYNVAANKMSANIEITPIKALKVKDETIPRLRNSFIKLGYGNYNTPYGEIFVNSIRSKEFQAGVRLKHLSSNSDLNDHYKNSRYSQNEAEIYGKRFYENELLSSNISYARNAYHFYGYNTDLYTTKDITDQQQFFTDFTINTNIADLTQGKKQLNHNVNIRYNYYSDNYNAQENTIAANFNLNNKYDVATLGLNGTINYSNNRQPNNNLMDRAIFTINPYATKQINNYTLTGGLNANIEAGAVSGFHLYPQLEALCNIADNFMIAYAGMNGRMEKNTLRDFSIGNPFINTQLNLQNTRSFEIKGGLKGSFSHTTTYNAGVTWSLVSNMPLYVADTNFIKPTRFTVIYDDASVTIIHAEIGHRLNDKWLLTTRAQYANAKMSHELLPWYLPIFTYTLSTTYNMSNKILLHMDVLAHSTRAYKVYKPVVDSKSLPGIVDANIGVEYRYSKLFSLFLNFNNIGSVNFYKWENYPTQRFQALCGLTYSF